MCKNNHPKYEIAKKGIVYKIVNTRRERKHILSQWIIYPSVSPEHSRSSGTIGDPNMYK